MGLLPSMKLLASTRPPTAAEVNYNFTALWNLINGHVDAANAPTLLSKLTGGDIQAALRIINQGIVIGNAVSPVGIAGKLLIDHASALLELAAAGTVSPAVGIQFSKTAGTPLWSLYYDGAGQLVLLPIGASTNFSVNAPITLDGTGQVKKTEALYMGAIAAGATAARVFRVPNDIRHAGGEVKLRCHVVASAIAAAAELDYRYVSYNEGDVFNVAGAALHSWADWASIVDGVHVTDWQSLTVPAATDQMIAVQVEVPAGPAVNMAHVNIELQYVVERIGLTTDAV